MNKKFIATGIGLVVVMCAAWIAYAAPRGRGMMPRPAANAVSATSTASTPTSTPPVAKSVKKSAPAPVAQIKIQTPGTFTTAQVAAHADATSCWTIIRGTVYDLTAWIGQHPGGAAAIKSLCGKDGTEAFTGKHGGQAQQESQLATFKIGVIAQ